MTRHNIWRDHFPVGLLITLSIIFILIVACCKKDEDASPGPTDLFECEAPTGYIEMRTCHRENDRDREDLLFRLRGKWDWQLKVEFSTAIDTNDTIYEGLHLEFLDEQQLVVDHDRRDTLFYDLRNVGSEGAELWVPDDSLYYLDGNIFLCKSELLVMYDEMHNGHRNWFCKME